MISDNWFAVTLVSCILLSFCAGGLLSRLYFGHPQPTQERDFSSIIAEAKLRQTRSKQARIENEIELLSSTLEKKKQQKERTALLAQQWEQRSNARTTSSASPSASTSSRSSASLSDKAATKLALRLARRKERLALRGIHSDSESSEEGGASQMQIPRQSKRPSSASSHSTADAKPLQSRKNEASSLFDSSKSQDSHSLFSRSPTLQSLSPQSSSQTSNLLIDSIDVERSSTNERMSTSSPDRPSSASNAASEIRRLAWSHSAELPSVSRPQSSQMNSVTDAQQLDATSPQHLLLNRIEGRRSVSASPASSPQSTRTLAVAPSNTSLPLLDIAARTTRLLSITLDASSPYPSDSLSLSPSPPPDHRYEDTALTPTPFRLDGAIDDSTLHVPQHSANVLGLHDAAVATKAADDLAIDVQVRLPRSHSISHSPTQRHNHRTAQRVSWTRGDAFELVKSQSIQSFEAYNQLLQQVKPQVLSHVKTRLRSSQSEDTLQM